MVTDISTVTEVTTVIHLSSADCVGEELNASQGEVDTDEFNSRSRTSPGQTTASNSPCTIPRGSKTP